MFPQQGEERERKKPQKTSGFSVAFRMQVSPYKVPMMASPSHCAVKRGSLVLVVFYPDTPEMSFPCEGGGGLMPAVRSGVSPSLGSLTRAVWAGKPRGRRPWADCPAD